MKKKLFTAMLVFGLVAAPASVDAKKNEDQRTPKWVKQAWNAGMRCPKIEDDLRKIGLPVKGFSYLAWRESRCRAKVIGYNFKPRMGLHDCADHTPDAMKRCAAVDSFDSGLWQVNSSWVTLTAQVCGAEWGNLEVLTKKNCNLRMAKTLFENGGYQHWRIAR